MVREFCKSVRFKTNHIYMFYSKEKLKFDRVWQLMPHTCAIRIAGNFQPVLQSDTLSQKEMKANELQLVHKIFTITSPKHEPSEVHF